jgi:hypothetical protein
MGDAQSNATDTSPQAIAQAVLLGRIEEQLHQHGDLLKQILNSQSAHDGRLRLVEQDVATLKADRTKPPSQWPAIISSVAAIAAIGFTFFAVLYQR